MELRRSRIAAWKRSGDCNEHLLIVCGLAKQRSGGVVGVVGVVGAVSTDGRCLIRYSLMDNLRLGNGAGSGTVSMGFSRGSWLAVRVYNLSGVVAGGGMLSIAATAATLAGDGGAIAVTDAAATAVVAAVAATATVAAFDLVASKYSAKLGMLLLCNLAKGEETAGNVGGSCNLP